ncbi:hypothetical protein Clacol_006881 [Clathrus columnatus]|uniref:4-coumarate--CoA ligase n=1 Tax=Clathrus columnatus TaxID=1419009 RepID=A0AAV5AHN4_9AGAM|nr:hypothetical protein Clacol_006881 [Clathrus columnatus]
MGVSIKSVGIMVFSKNLDAHRPAYIDAKTTQTLTRGDVYTQSLRLAWSLRNTLKQKPGMTMAIFSPNSITWPILLLGGIAAGLRITTINTSYTPNELRHQLEDSGAFHIFTHPTLVEIVVAALKSMKVSDIEIQNRVILLPGLIQLSNSENKHLHFNNLLGPNQLETEESFNGSASDDTVFLCYSSGTTGKSKGVELTHHGVVSVLCLARFRFGYINSTDAMLLSFLPFFHVYGLVKLLLSPFFAGCPQVIMSGFLPEDFCACIERYKITVSLIVPPVLVVLANHPVSAAPIGKDLIMAVHRRWEKRGTDVKIIQGWGLTETSPTCTAQKLEDFPAKIGSVGGLLAGLEAQLVKDNGIDDADEGEPGEIWIKGPNVMKGYLNNPDATRNAITPDGWLKTGDIAVVDKDGDFTILDRKKELIKYKGFQGDCELEIYCVFIPFIQHLIQVAPAELEDILLSHPKIVDAGVIGVWSENEATEFPRAYVVPVLTCVDRETLSKEIQIWFQSQVARHKYLRGGVVVIDAIPKSASGKILRKTLRELYKAGADISSKANL